MTHPSVGCTKEARKGVSYILLRLRTEKGQPDNNRNAIAKRSVLQFNLLNRNRSGCPSPRSETCRAKGKYHASTFNPPRRIAEASAALWNEDLDEKDKCGYHVMESLTEKLPMAMTMMAPRCESQAGWNFRKGQASHRPGRRRKELN